MSGPWVNCAGCGQLFWPIDGRTRCGRCFPTPGEAQAFREMFGLTYKRLEGLSDAELLKTIKVRLT